MEGDLGMLGERDCIHMTSGERAGQSPRSTSLGGLFLLCGARSNLHEVTTRPLLALVQKLPCTRYAGVV